MHSELKAQKRKSDDLSAEVRRLREKVLHVRKIFFGFLLILALFLLSFIGLIIIKYFLLRNENV